MNQEIRQHRRSEAAAAFDQRLNRSDGARVAGNLSDGLNLLCDLFYTRIHVDVEKAFGMDSMLMPVSPLKSEENTKAEIAFYQIAEAAAEAIERGYVDATDNWFLEWLSSLQLEAGLETPHMEQRLGQYTSRSPQERRRMFAVLVQRSLPEASRAPLVVYRLFPLSIGVATTLAFGDHPAALEARKRQVAILPGIGDCHECRGNVLENGERCNQCGNPLWKFDWLTAE